MNTNVRCQCNIHHPSQPNHWQCQAGQGAMELNIVKFDHYLIVLTRLICWFVCTPSWYCTAPLQRVDGCTSVVLSLISALKNRFFAHPRYTRTRVFNQRG